MRLHVDIAHLDMLGQHDGDGRRLVAQLAAVFECEPHRIGMRHAALDRLADCGVKFGGAVALQQPQQGGGDGSEIVAALCGAQEQGLALRRHFCELVGAAVAACGALVLDQGLDMGGILDLRPFVVAAAMTGEHQRAIDDAHLGWIGQHR